MDSNCEISDDTHPCRFGCLSLYVCECIVAEVQIGLWWVRRWTVERLTTSEHLVLPWHFTSWCWRSLTIITYCAWLLLRLGNGLWTKRINFLTWPLENYVFILLHVACHGCCLQCWGLSSPTRTCRSGSRSAAVGRAPSSGRCRLPVWGALPDGEAVSVPQSLFLPEAPSYNIFGILRSRWGGGGQWIPLVSWRCR